MNCPYYEQVTEAYLSGEIEGLQWRTHLQNCLDCTAKLSAESDFDLIIKQAVTEERLQTRQLESHVRAAIRKSSPWRLPIFVMVRYAIAASVFLGTLTIATIGYARGRIDLSAICVDAVDDHREEIIDKAPRRWRSDPKQLATLSQKITGDPSIPERVVPPGYHLIGARICDLHGKRYMHLDFSDGSNEISLFLRHQEEPNSLSSRVLEWFRPNAATERIDGLTVGSLQKKNLSLVLVSASPIPDVQKIVEQAGSKL
jgi:hypothetical protein